MISAQIFHEDALVDECAQAAKARGMHLISDGKKVVVSPIIPPGFFKVAVKIKCPTTASLTPTQCAA